MIKLYVYCFEIVFILGAVPSKRYKLYKDDPNVPIPRTTLYRQKSSLATATATGDWCENDTGSSQCNTAEDFPERGGECGITDTTFTIHNNCDDHVFFENEEAVEYTQNNVAIENDDFQHVNKNVEVVNSTQNNICVLPNELPEVIHFSETDSSSSSSKDNYSSTTESDSSGEEENNSEFETQNDPVLSPDQEKHMTFLAYANRHCLNREAVNHLMELFAINASGERENATASKIMNTVRETNAKLYDFCAKCFSLYPDDDSIFHCVLPTCTGLRYKGDLTKQELKQRKSFFACTEIEYQLKNILERKGIWKTMIHYRRKCLQEDGIKDILNGEIYANLRKPGNFLSSESNISLLFNTDGVPLYNSSKVGLWPVYLVINELPPVIRFSRQNMILWGVWQSKSKPAFQTYFRPFVQEMMKLKMHGFSINIDNEVVYTKAILLAGTLDLQAKAMILEMSHHNGEYACITCEEPGNVVPQGKGYARVFPFRINPAAKRTSNGMGFFSVDNLFLSSLIRNNNFWFYMSSPY